MRFLGHFFSQETLNESVDDDWPSSIIKMSVGAHSIRDIPTYSTLAPSPSKQNRIPTVSFSHTPQVSKIPLRSAKKASSAIGFSPVKILRLGQSPQLVPFRHEYIDLLVTIAYV